MRPREIRAGSNTPTMKRRWELDVSSMEGFQVINTMRESWMQFQVLFSALQNLAPCLSRHVFPMLPRILSPFLIPPAVPAHLFPLWVGHRHYRFSLAFTLFTFCVCVQKLQTKTFITFSSFLYLRHTNEHGWIKSLTQAQLPHHMGTHKITKQL